MITFPSLRAGLRSAPAPAPAGPGPGGARPPAVVAALAAQVKAELRAAFGRGEEATVADALARHPALAGHHAVMLSLLFEEFTLREDHGRAPDPESFCARYPAWGDSLAAQIRVHHELSRRVSLARELVAFPEEGERLLHYELDRELGEGGSARVFVARDLALGGRRCALKLAPDRGAEPALQGRLDHRHIVPVHSVEHDPESNLRALCMPYLPGVVLSDLIAGLHRGGPPAAADALPGALAAAGVAAEDPEGGPAGWDGFPAGRRFADAVAWVGLKLAEALAHAHGRGVCHRDIKPANLLLSWRHGPMLFDFNLAHARAEGQDAGSAATGGTLPYMAPEHLAAFLDGRRWGEVGPPADLYALGLVLRELLAGPAAPLAPVPASETARLIGELWAERSAGPPPPLRAAGRRDVPHALDAILARLLEPDPARRYPDAAALAEDLRRHLARRPLQHAANPSRRERAGNWARRNRRAFGAAGLLAAGVLGLFAPASAGLRPEPEPAPPAPAPAAPPPAPTIPATARAANHVENGSYLVRAGRLDEAEARFRMASDLDPGLYTPHMGLARIAFDRGQYDAAIAAYTRALALVPPGRADGIVALDWRGRARFLLASRHQSEAVRRHGGDGGMRTDESDALMRAASEGYAGARDDFASALERARGEAGEAAPTESSLTADLDGRLANALLGLGDACSWFEEYAASVPTYQRALHHAERRGDFIAARLAPGGARDIPAEEFSRLEHAGAEVRETIAMLHERLRADEPKLAVTP